MNSFASYVDRTTSFMLTTFFCVAVFSNFGCWLNENVVDNKAKIISDVIKSDNTEICTNFLVWNSIAGLTTKTMTWTFELQKLITTLKFDYHQQKSPKQQSLSRYQFEFLNFVDCSIRNSIQLADIFHSFSIYSACVSLKRYLYFSEWWKIDAHTTLTLVAAQ